LVRRRALRGIERFFDDLPKDCYGVDDQWIGEFLRAKGVDVVRINSLKNSLSTLNASFFDPTALSFGKLSHSTANAKCTQRLSTSKDHMRNIPTESGGTSLRE